MADWLHPIPSTIWHTHVVLASDRCCTVLVPEVTDDLLDCLFFQSQRIICLTMATNATPGTLMEPWVVAACLLRSHLPQTNCVFVCVCVCGCERRWVSEWMCVPVCLHVQGHACGRTCSERCLANHPQSAGCLELSLIAAWLASCLDARGTFFLLYRMNQH